MFLIKKMDAAKKILAHGGRQCHRTGCNIKKPPVLGKTRFFKTEVDVRLSFGFEEKKKNMSECPRFQDSRERVSLSFGFEEKKKNFSECTRFQHSRERVSLPKKRSRSFVVDEFSCLSDKRNRVSDPSVVSKEEDIEEGEIVEDVLTSACNANTTTKKTQSSETLITLSRNVSDSEPKSEIDENRAVRAAMLKTRFADTILKAQEKLISTTKPGRWSHLHQLEDKKARIITEIAAAKDLLKQHRETERKNEAARRQIALELKKKRIQKEREAFRKSLENMKNTANFVDGREIQREFELLVGAPVTQFKRFTRDSAEYHRFYALD